MISLGRQTVGGDWIYGLLHLLLKLELPIIRGVVPGVLVTVTFLFPGLEFVLFNYIVIDAVRALGMLLLVVGIAD